MERQKSKFLGGLEKIYNRFKGIYKNSIARVRDLRRREEGASPGTDVNCGVSKPRATLYHHDCENLFDNLWGWKLRIGTVVEEKFIAYSSNMRVKLKPRIWIIENSVTDERAVITERKNLRRVRRGYIIPEISAAVKCPGNNTLRSRIVSVHAPRVNTKIFGPYRAPDFFTVYTLELNSDFNYEVVKVERLDSMIIV